MYFDVYPLSYNLGYLFYFYTPYDGGGSFKTENFGWIEDWEIGQLLGGN